MEKRFQIFISSTFEDLKDERQAALKAILELNHMPAGMELFPASDESAWQLIKDVIDGSDYYVLIIGGRYGSLDEKGLGYTEKEYDYAIETSKPVIPLLHKNPDNLPRDKTETNSDVWDKLQQFRKKVEGKHTCVYWNSAEELHSKLIIGLTSTIKRHPEVGWIRADKIPSEDIINELLELRTKNLELKNQLDKEKLGPPKGAEDLVQGENSYKIHCDFSSRKGDPKSVWGYTDTSFKANIDTTWNEMWGAIAPKLINEASNYQIKEAFKKYFEAKAIEVFKDHKDLKGTQLVNFSFNDTEIETALVQFRALGLLKESIKARSIKDTNTYWTMTNYGDQLMVQLRAIRTKPKVVKKVESKVEQDTNKEDAT